MRPSGLAHGVFLRNSNGIDVVLGSNSLLYRTIGGVLDFYFFLGPHPEGVVQQYQEVIGRPHMPPYWSLGFHNCRYGYPNVETLEKVVANYSSAMIPLETMWTDIDYMDQYRDFTLDPNNFPQDKMNAFLDNLHSNGQHYVVIVDPGIAIMKGYPPYDQGLEENAFIKDKNGNVFIGRVWPGYTAFTDFMNFDTHSYWQDQIASFLQLLPVDGLWIDMNEISNFCSGACSTESADGVNTAIHGSEQRVKNSQPTRLKSKTRTRLRRSGTGNRRVGFDPTNPPYSINNFGNKAPLNTKTLDMDALHMNGAALEYNAHNTFGLSEAIATNKALENLKKKRSFIISRSTFPGSGSHTGHWTGDNHATFDDLEHSIIGMLNFQLFGIPLVGSDICGFHDSTTVELCTRWIEVGAFYPFSRDHNDNQSHPQELYRWPEVATVARKVLSIRYSILPLYYTLFYKAHTPVTMTTPPAATVTRPLFFEFPSDVNTFGIHTQFLIGPAIMISPVSTQGATTKNVYFPRARWFDWYNQSVAMEKGGEMVNLPAPLDHVLIHIRGGYIIPMQEPGMTTVASRKNPFSLLVALDETGSASGDVYLDDGESLDMSNYTFVNFSCSKSSLTGSVSGTGWAKSSPPLSSVTVLGLDGAVSKATLNGQSISNVHYNSTTQSVLLSGFQTSLASDFTIIWE
ncbi:Probable alpha-glucosidase Os06g0675700 [Geodia barretti]|uniref:Probable alpha-glucosidase Os06g0675700 n=2 Tax=Geodia barretti TaxID=519541 RepID=A0AA35RU65_GEOBA|nr:Probable alpha-glucosidase Os06g0675700 [Geodia barretti]